jgi:hypothetical protein
VATVAYRSYFIYDTAFAILAGQGHKWRRDEHLSPAGLQPV